MDDISTKALRSKLSFPLILSEKVNLSLVHLPCLEPWIRSKVSAILGEEDEIVIGMVMEALRPKPDAATDPKGLMTMLVTFLFSKTAEFMEGLWALLLEAQANGGVPVSMKKVKAPPPSKRGPPPREAFTVKKANATSSSDSSSSSGSTSRSEASTSPRGQMKIEPSRQQRRNRSRSLSREKKKR